MFNLEWSDHILTFGVGSLITVLGIVYSYVFLVADKAL